MARKYINKRYDFTGDVQILNVTPGDVINLELYGSTGESSSSKFSNGGKGGKVTGKYTVPENIYELYLYIGSYNGYNGGGSKNGGGATDIRLIKASEGSWYDTSHSSWDTDKSLRSRIAVAGGGGAGNHPASTTPFQGGHGGGLIGSDGVSNYISNKGATQTAGGKGQPNNGQFGKGGNGYHNGGAGGGGWYGGGGGSDRQIASGAGGSSYIDLLEDGETLSGVNSGIGYAIIKLLGYGILFMIRGQYYGIDDNNNIIGINKNLTLKNYKENGLDININDYIDKLKTFDKFKIRKIKE